MDRKKAGSLRSALWKGEVLVPCMGPWESCLLNGADRCCKEKQEGALGATGWTGAGLGLEVILQPFHFRCCLKGGKNGVGGKQWSGLIS